MQNRSDNPNPMQEAMKIASTPAGQQLMQYLRQSGGKELKQALSSAAAGNYEQAKQTIQALLSDPEARKLLDRLGR